MRKVGGATRLLIIVSIVVSGVGLAAAPASAAPALTVTPGPTGLLDQQVVTVTGTGFEANEELLIVQCIGDVPDWCPVDPVVNTNAAYATADGSGAVTATLRLPRVLEHGEGVDSCESSDCSIVAIARDDGAERARRFVDFESTGTAPLPAPPSFTIATDSVTPTSATVTLTGSGFWPWFDAVPYAGPAADLDIGIQGAEAMASEPGAHLALCTGSPTVCEPYAGPALYSLDGGASPLNGMSPTKVAPVAADGTVSVQWTIPRIWKTHDDRIDCAHVPCSFALVQDDLVSQTATVEWAQEAVPWPSSGDLIDDAYAALVGQPAPDDEYSYYRMALLDRVITARTLIFGLTEHPDGRRVAELTRLYRAALNRRPDAGGLTYWAGELERNGGSMSAIAVAFGRTPEFRASFGSGTNAQAVDAAYLRTLGRQPSNQDRAYWVGRLQAGLARTHMIHLFSRSPEFLGRERFRSAIVAIRHGFLGTVSTAAEWAELDPDRPPHPNPSAPPWPPVYDRADDILLGLIASGALVGD